MATTTTVARPTPQVATTPRARVSLGTIGRYAAMLFIGLILFGPFILAFLGSFKTNAEITAFPPTFFPAEWQWQNWPRLFNTDVGGTATLTGSASLGLMTGLFAAFSTFLMTGLSSEVSGRGMSRSVGTALSVGLALASGAASAIYLRVRADADTVEWLTVAIAVASLMLIATLLMGMSRPDWRRVVTALLWSIAIGAVVTLAVDQIALLAGGGRFWRWLFNTALLSVMRAFFQLIFCAMAAYAFARLRFPGREAVFSIMLATMMIPGAVTLVPAYILMAKLNWVNRAYSLVIPGLISAGSIFLLTQFLKAIPRDLEEAAYMDGASYFQSFKDIVLPLARPALLTVFILQFQATWNDYLGPLLYLQQRDMWVMNVALGVFKGQFRSELNIVLVAAILNALPVLILFFFFSRYYIEGVAYAGVKG